MKNKYNAHKCAAMGKEFDSRHERDRFLTLLAMEQRGEISQLRTQVPFVLILKQLDENGKCLERQCVYRADFVYVKGGEEIVEDAKGYRESKAYDIFVIKRKLMLQRYGLRIREV